MTYKTSLRSVAIAAITSGVALAVACGPNPPSGGGDDNNDNNTNNTTGSNNTSNNTVGTNNSNNTVGTNNSNNTAGTNNTTTSNNSNNTTGTNNSNNTTGSNNSNNTTGTNNSNNTNNTNGTNNTNQADRMAASAAIADFRAEMTGTVTGAFVTYVRPSIGNDGAGFFIQAEQDGPAIFVAVDPATLTPIPAAGDEVELTADTVEVSNDVPQITAISAFSVLSNGNDIDPLVQDVNAVDLVTNLGDYESEVIDLTATIAGEFGFAGTDFVSAQIDTAGVTDNEDLLLRLPVTLADTLSLAVGCQVQLNGTPLWRFRADAQPSAWDASEIDILSCPAPTVVGAVATSDTEVVLTFDRPIDAASITNAATQFTADNGLTVSAATVSGNEVTLTTSTQAGGTAYTITVADTVLDDLGGMVDQAANTATFNGFLAPAQVRINEFNVNIADGCDLVEIRVIEGGSLENFKLRFRTGTQYTFPAMVVAKNEYIIVHFDGGDDKCSNGNPTPADETQSVNEVPADAALNRNFATAYDVYTTSGNLSGASGVLDITDPTGAIVDALIYSDTGSIAGSSVTAADVLAAAGQWVDASGTARTAYNDADFLTDAITDVDNSTTEYNAESTNGTTIGRSDDTDSNNNVGWSDSIVESWGKNNPGQSDR
jgi:hypothetical protein